MRTTESHDCPPGCRHLGRLEEIAILMSTCPTPLRESYDFRGQPLSVARGSPLPLGASKTPGGVNFAVISQRATEVSLVLLESCNAEIQAEIPLDPVYFRTGYHW